MEILEIVAKLESYSADERGFVKDDEQSVVMAAAAALLIGQGGKIVDLEKKLEVLCYEHEAAMRDIQDIVRLGCVWMCPYCKHATSVENGFADCDLSAGPTPCRMPYTEFKWRGAPKGDA